VVGRTATLAFPRTFVDESVVAKAEALAADDAVGSGIRRAVGDEADDLRRVLAVRRAFP
jgi:aminopeptidase N